MTTTAEAVKHFEDDADAAIVARAREIVEQGTARWIVDPEVPGVWGLVKPGTNRALAVVYAPSDDSPFWDFELGEEWDA